MKTDYRYMLDKSSKKHHCPNCGKKSLKRYTDRNTGDHLPEQYGRCDHENSCVPHYHLNPYLDGYAKAIQEQEKGNRSELPNNWKPQRKKVTPQPTPEPVFFDFETFKQTLRPERYSQNVFIQNLLSRVAFPFDAKDVTKVVHLYRLGTVKNGYRAGAITFPYIDTKDNVRAIQVKQFDQTNHTTGTDFLHSIIEKHHTRNDEPSPEWLEAYTKQDKRVSCLFGSHLLSMFPFNPIALVEAPKTAIYGTLYFGYPENTQSLIWLAVYNKSSFSFDKLKVLQGRFVYVFPDLSKDGNTFKEWETKTKEYESRLPGTRFIFSDLLEQLAPEQDKREGNDLADYLIKRDWRLFRKQPPQPEPEKVTLQTKYLFSHVAPLPKVEVSVSDESDTFKSDLESYESNYFKRKQPDDWTNEINELETFFDSIVLPESIRLNQCAFITDVKKNISVGLCIVKANNGIKVHLPYLHQLQELKQALTINLN